MSVRYMLDTDTASYVIKGGHPDLDRRLASAPLDDLCVSIVTRAELLYGVRLKPGAHRLARVVAQFLARVPSLPWDEAAADQFATIAAELHTSGTQIGTYDTMIAAHALANNAVVVTNNTAHYSRVSGLALENWAQSAAQ